MHTGTSRFSEEAPDAKTTAEDRLRNYLKESLPVQARDNLKIYSVFRIVVAAIAYYRDYLEGHTHPQSLLRTTTVWNDDIPHICAR